MCGTDIYFNDKELYKASGHLNREILGFLTLNILTPFNSSEPHNP